MSKNTYKVNTFLDNAKAEAQKVNGEFKGAVVHISVEVGEANIRQKDIRNAIESCSSIPTEWLPEVHNNLTLYFQVISEMKRAGIKNFIIPPGITFNIEDHAGYTVDKVYQNSQDRYPTAHKIFRKTKFNNKVVDHKNLEMRNIQDVNNSEGLVIMLERVSGTVKDDDNGTSEFDLVLDPERAGQDIDEYMPFIETLKTRFQDKINGIYDSRQIRDILLKIVKTDVGAISIQTGLYYVPANSINPIYELAEAMQKVHAGIRIQMIPIIHFKDAPMFNKHVEDVKVSLTENILSEVKSFNQTIKTMAEDEDSKTRDSTWLKRLGELRRYKDLLTELKNDNMITIDILEELLEETEEIITEQI